MMTLNYLLPEALFAIYDEISVLFCQRSNKKPNINIINTIFEGINVFQEYKKNYDVADIAAHLASSFLKEKPFYVHNKRMTLIATEVFLNINGYNLNASDPFYVINIKDLENHSMSEDEFAVWLRRHIQPKENNSEE
ncbi:MAG: hypothetical protein AB7U85_09210 [Alphaproteobacteria bacterium]